MFSRKHISKQTSSKKNYASLNAAKNSVPVYIKAII